MIKTAKRIIVLKTGSTLDALLQEQGDFEDWVYRGLDVPQALTQTVDPRADDFPPLDTVAGVIVTGSHDMVTEHLDWSERSAVWLRSLVQAGIPVLGICYGHQLLAYALGGEIGYHPHGKEFGTKTVNLNEKARSDSLLGEEYPTLKGHLCHTQFVLRAPEHAEILGTTDVDTCTSFRVGQCAWGVQFHPEFNLSTLQTYTRTFADDLIAQGDNPDAILASEQEIASGTRILKRFGGICLNRTS